MSPLAATGLSAAYLAVGFRLWYIMEGPRLFAKSPFFHRYLAHAAVAVLWFPLFCCYVVFFRKEPL